MKNIFVVLKKHSVSILCALALLLFMGGVYLGHRFVRHERAQNARISQLIGITEYLEERINQSVDYYKYAVSYGDDTFNYLAIGNSLTLIKGYGRGICATQPDNDYFGLVISYIKSTGKEVIARRFNYYAWEKMTDRAKALCLLKPFLDRKLSLVTIQLGENVSDLTTYQRDLVYLVQHIRSVSPRAKIVMVGDFWDKAKNDMRRQAAGITKCEFADLQVIIGDKEYQSEVGIVCTLRDGTTYRVPDIAVTHPGDKGMKYIADRIIERL